jgi:radical SAM protein with 4Fe4S-binding SPASM domain
VLYYDDQYQVKYNEISDEVLEKYYFKNNRIADLIKQNNVRTVIENSLRPNEKHCKAGVKHIYMDSNGDIYPCEFIKDKTTLLKKYGINNNELNLGNVRDNNYNIKKILEMNYYGSPIEKAVCCCHCGVPDIHRMNNWDNLSRKKI